MKVILQRDVANVGKRHDEVEVANGYALNKLVPQGWAVPATESAKKKLAARADLIAAEQAASSENYQSVLAALQAEVLTIEMEANENDQLFKAVGQDDIAAAAQKRDLPLTSDMVQIDTNIKSLGEHKVMLVSGSDSNEVTITVVRA